MITEKDLKNFEKYDSIIEENEDQWTEEFIALIKEGEFYDYSFNQFMLFKVFVIECGSTLIKEAIEAWEEHENKKLDEDDYFMFSLAVFHHAVLDDIDSIDNPFLEYEA